MDDTLRARLEQLIRELRGFKEDCDAHFYGIGRRLSEVNRARLHTLQGYDNFTDWLREVIDIRQAQAYKWMAVADNFSEEAAGRLGVEVCAAYLAHIRATPEDDRPADIERAEIEVVAPDGTVTRKPVAEATVAEIEAATARIRARGVPGLTPELVALQAKLAAVVPEAQPAISSRGPKPTLSLGTFPLAGACGTLTKAASALSCAGFSSRLEKVSLGAKDLRASGGRKKRRR